MAEFFLFVHIVRLYYKSYVVIITISASLDLLNIEF